MRTNAAGRSASTIRRTLAALPAPGSISIRWSAKRSLLPTREYPAFNGRRIILRMFADFFEQC